MEPALRWEPRDPPLVPAAVTARGEAARALARAGAVRALAGAPLRAVSAGDRLVLLGDEADLPWCDGARYLGWDAGALTPTTSRPTSPADLVHQAARRLLDDPGAALLVVVPGAVLGAPTPRRGVDAATLLAWAGEPVPVDPR